MLSRPANDCGDECNRDIPVDPYLRYQTFGPNSCAPGKAIDDSSELGGLNYKSTKCSADQYMPGKYNEKGVCSAPGNSADRACLAPTEDTRLSNPACTLRSTGWNRWEWLCWNPQDRAIIPFEWNTSYRIVAKDNHAPCFELPLDQTSFYPNEKSPDHPETRSIPVWTPPKDCVQNSQIPYYATSEHCGNIQKL
jgi:hypothetical protein